jgi:protease I
MKKNDVKFKIMIVTFFVFFAVSCTSTSPSQEETPKARIAVMVAEGFHDGEAYMPMGYLLNQGYHITVIGPARGIVKSYNSDFTINIEKAVSEVSVDDFDALILPGGRGPAVLREDSGVLAFVRAFWDSGKVTAAICHGPQVLITAGVLDGRTTTGVGGIREELEGAGVKFLDQPVVVDGNLVTSRVPQDLHDFSLNIVEALKKQMN